MVEGPPADVHMKNKEKWIQYESPLSNSRGVHIQKVVTLGMPAAHLLLNKLTFTLLRPRSLLWWDFTLSDPDRIACIPYRDPWQSFPVNSLSPCLWDDRRVPLSLCLTWKQPVCLMHIKPPKQTHWLACWWGVAEMSSGKRSPGCACHQCLIMASVILSKTSLFPEKRLQHYSMQGSIILSALQWVWFVLEHPK